MAGTQLITIAEARSRLAISQAQIFKLLAKGTFSRVKIGKSTRLLETEIEAFINANTHLPKN